VNAKDRNYESPLHYAAFLGHKEIPEVLIAKGADLNAKGNSGETPLHQAADAGHKEIAKLLIANGVDVNAKDHKGETSLDFATNPENQFKSEEFIELLRKHGGKTAKELKAEGK
jgi:ankyrin repeat protein